MYRPPLTPLPSRPTARPPCHTLSAATPTRPTVCPHGRSPVRPPGRPAARQPGHPAARCRPCSPARHLSARPRARLSACIRPSFCPPDRQSTRRPLAHSRPTEGAAITAAGALDYCPSGVRMRGRCGHYIADMSSPDVREPDSLRPQLPSLLPLPILPPVLPLPPPPPLLLLLMLQQRWKSGGHMLSTRITYGLLYALAVCWRSITTCTRVTHSWLPR